MAVAATVLFFNTAFAQCDSGCGGGGYADAGFAGAAYGAGGGYGGGSCDGGCGGNIDAGFGGGIATGGFDYPGGGGGCGGAGCGGGGKFGGAIAGHKANFSAWKAHVKEINRISMARNGAWPKPFACADRQLYFQFWQPMIQSGINANCLLSDHHFDGETGELNAAGKSRLRSIAQNNPVGQKAVLIQNTGDQMVNNQRQTYVQQVVSDWYGGSGFSQVAVSNSFPIRGPGARIETLDRLYSEGTAPPIIPVASGSGSTTQTSQ